VSAAERGRLAMAIVALNDGKLFQRLSATRHRCQSSAFVLSFHYLDADLTFPRCASDKIPPIFLGFVLPKRLVKRAVDRNQIKRWARTLLRTEVVDLPCAVVIKAKTKMVVASSARCEVREELRGLVQQWTRQIRDSTTSRVA
jgi:ribonuclease P protein component